MKRLAVLLSLAFLSPAVAHADGCPPVTCGTTSTTEPGSGLLIVRPNGQQGPLVAYGAGGVQRFTLPSGTLVADGKHFVTSRTGKHQTTVALRSVSRGGKLIDRWALDARGWVSTVSADAHWVVLQQYSKRNTSVFALFDTTRGRVVDHVRLHGSYQPEALSTNGRLLFLIHWTRYTYDLRTFDLASRELRPTRLAEPDEKMTGTASVAIATRDGRWLLTLYVESDGMDFVHALDLKTGIAHCVDLPWKGTGFNELGTAAVALSPKQDKLYLANPLLGRLAVVDLQRARLTRDIRFTPVAGSAIQYGVWPSATLTPNGRMLAFSGGRNVWLYDTAYGVVRGPFAAAERAQVRTGVYVSVTALGFARDGRRLAALTSDRSHASFDAATGRRLDGTSSAEIFSVQRRGGHSVLGFDNRGGPRFVLPNGRLSADGKQYVTALPHRSGGTSIQRYAPQTGGLRGSYVVTGRWTLGAVSASGSTIAIARQADRTTWVRVLDAKTGNAINARTLHGVYTLDAVTDDGQKVFLIQHYRHSNYAVRALDFVHGRLWTATLREKGATEEPVMSGTAAGQVASPDGRWLLTLYLNTKERKAFVHALNLRAAFAVCIDLPSRAPLAALRGYSLALAPDGGVYATNGVLGVIAHVDLRQEAVTDTLRFAPERRGFSWAASALSQNGRLLYFASGKNIWRYDITLGKVRGPFFAPGPVLGLAFSRDGKKVFAARSDGGVAAFDAQRGTILRA